MNDFQKAKKWCIVDRNGYVLHSWGGYVDNYHYNFGDKNGKHPNDNDPFLFSSECAASESLNHILAGVHQHKILYISANKELKAFFDRFPLKVVEYISNEECDRNRKICEDHKMWEEGSNIVITSNCRILNPDRVKALYEEEGEAVTWGSMHYKYIMNTVIEHKRWRTIIVTLSRNNAGASWELLISPSMLPIAISPLEWVRRARTTRWPGEDFEIHYELMEGLEELK
jgi:hypothetical protein